MCLLQIGAETLIRAPVGLLDYFTDVFSTHTNFTQALKYPRKLFCLCFQRIGVIPAGSLISRSIASVRNFLSSRNLFTCLFYVTIRSCAMTPLRLVWPGCLLRPVISAVTVASWMSVIASLCFITNLYRIALCSWTSGVSLVSWYIIWCLFSCCRFFSSC